MNDAKTTDESRRRIAEMIGKAKRELIEAYNVAQSAGIAGTARTLDRLAGELERLQLRTKPE